MTKQKRSHQNKSREAVESSPMIHIQQARISLLYYTFPKSRHQLYLYFWRDSLQRSRTCCMASSPLYLGLNFGGPFHFETGLHVTTTTVSVYGIYRYFTCLLSDSNFLQKGKKQEYQLQRNQLIPYHSSIIQYLIINYATPTQKKSLREREYSTKKDEIKGAYCI